MIGDIYYSLSYFISHCVHLGSGKCVNYKFCEKLVGRLHDVGAW